ncbi:DNA polymerase III subunit gamma and tau [Arcanobacterium bovis]|uniref:DNA-directed DNA polymerase n=1 Tax=Arcanobacterium bovis TaxID=2529275 RepID=A0A4Q9V2G6_9ACTO|nr:DNA polymerase III subunit gamma and tau [Arcanobacterium bovis]TBW23841.1 DNA polymerase III subunit gamma and tau [Arcanobacterium bovis]
MSIALYRRYRPQTFQEVIGQEHVTEPLMAALEAGRTTHAYLFSGPRGCGKTTSARILARALNCAEYPTDTPCGVCESCRELSRDGSGSLDVVELDAASHGGVDDARELREQAGFAPVRDRFKIFIIDEAHMVSNQGFNALLKLVEEPPPHVKFIFATTEPEKVIGTIRSRTHHYPFRLVPPPVLENYLAQLCAHENITAGHDLLSLVVRAGTGSVRDTLSVLDQIIGGSDGVTLDYESAVALLGYTSASLLDETVRAISAQDGAALFAVVDAVVRSGHDPRRFVEDLLQRLRDLVIIALAGESVHDVFVSVPDDQYALMVQQAQELGARRASRSADLVNEALSTMAGATAPRLQLELLCARLIVAQADAVAPVVPTQPVSSGNVAGGSVSGTAPSGAMGSAPAPASGAGTSASGVARPMPNMPNMPSVPNVPSMPGAPNIGASAQVPSPAPSVSQTAAEPAHKPVVDPRRQPMPSFAAVEKPAAQPATNAESTANTESATGAIAAPQAKSASETAQTPKPTTAAPVPENSPAAAPRELSDLERIQAKWTAIIAKTSENPEAAQVLATSTGAVSFENNVIVVGFVDDESARVFNFSHPTIFALAHAVFDETGLKTRCEGRFVPPDKLANPPAGDDGVHNTAADSVAWDADFRKTNGTPASADSGERPPKVEAPQGTSGNETSGAKNTPAEHASTSSDARTIATPAVRSGAMPAAQMPTAEPTAGGSTATSSPREPITSEYLREPDEFEDDTYEYPANDPAYDPSCDVAQAEGNDDATADPAGVLAPLVDGIAIPEVRVGADSELGEVADHEEPALALEVEGVSAPVSNESRRASVPERTSSSPQEMPQVNEQAVTPVAKPQETPQASPNVPFYAQNMPAPPPLKPSFARETEPERLAFQSSHFASEASVERENTAQSIENPMPAKPESDWDEVSLDDPEISQSNLVGINVVLDKFDAKVIEEISHEAGA